MPFGGKNDFEEMYWGCVKHLTSLNIVQCELIVVNISSIDVRESLLAALSFLWHVQTLIFISQFDAKIRRSSITCLRLKHVLRMTVIAAEQHERLLNEAAL